MIGRIVSWLAVRPLLTALMLVGAMTVPSLARVEALLRQADSRPPQLTEQEITDVVATYCRANPCAEIAPGDIMQAVAAYCRPRDECQGPRGPVGPSPTPGTTIEPDVPIPGIDEGERQEGELQETEIQEPEIQDAEIQEPPIPGPPGPPGPICPAGYTLREVRIPSESNRTVFLVCARG